MEEPKKLIVPSPISVIGTDVDFYELEMAMLAENRRGTPFMMGDNPALPKMPERPQLLDFYRLRFGRIE